MGGGWLGCQPPRGTNEGHPKEGLGAHRSRQVSELNTPHSKLPLSSAG